MQDKEAGRSSGVSARAVNALIIVAALAALAFQVGRQSPAGAGALLVPPEKRGEPLPSFTLKTLDGSRWSLSDARGGRATLLNVWATWCPPCRQETPDLVRVARRYEKKGLRVAGISADEGAPSVVRDFVEQYGIPYPVLMLSESEDGAALPFVVAGLPTTVLLDRQGRIAQTYIGAVTERQLTADIDQLLSEK